MGKKSGGRAITIDKPMVLIPVEEYEDLLREDGEVPTPKLSREVQQARSRFKKGNYVPWEIVKHAIKGVGNRRDVYR